MDRHPLHSSFIRPEQVETLLCVALVSAPATLKKETVPPAPAELHQGKMCFAKGTSSLFDNQLLKKQTIGKCTGLHKQLQETTAS